MGRSYGWQELSTEQPDLQLYRVLACLFVRCSFCQAHVLSVCRAGQQVNDLLSLCIFFMIGIPRHSLHHLWAVQSNLRVVASLFSVYAQISRAFARCWDAARVLHAGLW